MYAAIRRYHTDPASVDEITRRINEGFIPRIKDVEGFLAYYVVDAGAGEIATVSVFEDQAGAEESTRSAADWVRQNLAELLPDPPEVMTGEVGAYEAASAAGPLGAVTDSTSGVTDTVGGVTDRATDTVGGVTDKLLGGLGDQGKEEEPRRRDR